MGSIPHGTTTNAQGLAATCAAGAPQIGPRDITPFTIDGGLLKPQLSQTVSNENTERLPEDLTLFAQTGTITQDILNNPISILTEINNQLDIQETYTFFVSTSDTNPLSSKTSAPAVTVGGGTANIAFLLGAANSQLGPNANTVEMDATFWVEIVNAELTVPAGSPASKPLLLQPPLQQPNSPNLPPSPTFKVVPPYDITSATIIKVSYTQVQYAQLVYLAFHTLNWPHLSQATLVPTLPLDVPSSAFPPAP